MFKGKNITLLDYQKPTGKQWIVLEAMNSEYLFEEKVKLFHVFDFKDQNLLSLGRGHSAHAKLSDISISREHAFLRFIDNEIYIEDANSKFG